MLSPTLAQNDTTSAAYRTLASQLLNHTIARLTIRRGTQTFEAVCTKDPRGDIYVTQSTEWKVGSLSPLKSTTFYLPKSKRKKLTVEDWIADLPDTSSEEDIQATAIY